MILHLLSQESGFYEERPKTEAAQSLHTSDTQDQDRNPRLSFDRPESASMVEVLDVVTSVEFAERKCARSLEGECAKGYSPGPFAEPKKGSLLNPIRMFSDWALRRQGK